MKAVFLVLLLSLNTVYAQTSLIPKQKDFKFGKEALKEKSSDKSGKEEPCLDSAEEVMRKLEEEKKKKEAAGKALNLQGSNDAGCSID